MLEFEENTHFTIITQEDLDQFKRLDQFLAEKFPDFSRNYLKTLFEMGLIKASKNNEPVKINLKKMPELGVEIGFTPPPPQPTTAVAKDIPLDIIFEDDYLLFVNKPAGMVVHPAPGHYEDTLVNALLFHCPNLAGIGAQLRPGIVHRLDKGTTGIMVVAKEQKCHQGLTELFSRHDIKRQYQAIVTGRPNPVRGQLTGQIGRHPYHRQKMSMLREGQGRFSSTHYQLLESWGPLSHLQFELETGRTHQIRVHCSHLLKLPILGDTVYGNWNVQKRKLPMEWQEKIQSYGHPLLHAKMLGLVHPITKEELLFEVPPPKPFSDLLTEASKIWQDE